MAHFLKKLWERKVVRFLVIGCFNTTLDTSLLLIIVKISGWPAFLANSLSAAIAISVSYFLNHRIVFRYTSSYSFKKYVRFLLGTGLGVILIQDIVIYLVTDKFWIISKTKRFMFLQHDFYDKTAELLAAKLFAVICGLAWNYVLYKYIIFRDPDTVKPKEDELIVG